MQDKISVYEEILAMEPGSKFFFPMAKLLVDSGEYSRAEKILLQGLAAHPEYLEARLLLLDVLEQQGSEDDAIEHGRQVLHILKKYKGFWNIWHKILAMNSEKDTQTALDFVRASLQGTPLAWSNIFEQGLCSVLAESKRGTEVVHDEAVHGRESIAQTVPCSDPESEHLMDVDSHHLARLESVPVDEGEDVQEFDSSVKPDTAVALSDRPVAEQPVSKIAQDDALEPVDDADAEEVEDISMDSDVRTRTMADLLMQQEEYGQAAAIYEELWKESLPGPERRELAEVLEEARSNMRESEADKDFQTPQATALDTSTIVSNNDTDETIKTLSALADRLEQRAKQA